MSYTIKKSDGTTLAIVPENDIVLDKASVALIGRGSTNYGILHSEAFVHLLENFAHTSPPENPLDGQLWFDKTIGSLKFYKDGNWNIVGSGIGPTGANGSGPIFVQIGSSSVLALIAGGKVVAAVASEGFTAMDLPVAISVLEASLPFRSRFPTGLGAGFNLAEDPLTRLEVIGNVPLAEAANYTGGGNPFAATTYVDLGPYSVALTISNDVLVAAYSQVAIAAASLPTNFTINKRSLSLNASSRSTVIETLTMPFRDAFPNGLRAGLTLASGMSLGIGGATISGSGTTGGSGGSVTTEIVAEMINAETTARASAVSNLYAYANSTFATAGIVNTLEATFKSATGQSSLASAIEYLVVTAGSGTANADYGVQLKAEITNAVTGATSFAHALQILNTRVTGDYATASDITSLESRVTDARTTAISTAIQGLVTTAGLNGSLANFKTQLNTEFENATGYTSFASAVQDLKTTSNGNGSTSAFDTDLRTRFTNAMQTGEAAGAIQTISQAMDKFKTFSGSLSSNKGSIDEIVGALKQLTGTPVQNSTASAIQSLVSDSKLTGALATFKTNLTAEYVSNMNELTGGSGTTFAGAMADILASATSDGSGSTSSIDTTLRNTFINFTHEADYPVTSISQAVQKLMSNTTKDRALSTQVTQLENIFTGAFGTGLSSAQQALTTLSQKANAGNDFAADLKAKLVSKTGKADWVAGLDYLAQGGAGAGTSAQAITDLRSEFTSNVPGSTNVANAVQIMYSKANALGATSLWGFNVEAGNKIAGIRAIADSATGTSDISFRADTFKFYHPNTPDIVPFEIYNNSVRIRNLLIGDSNVTAENLQQMQFTTEVYRGSYQMPNYQHAIYGGAMAVSTGPVPAGSKVVIFFSSNVTGEDKGGMFCNIQRNDGVYTQGTAEFGNPDEGGSAQAWTFSDTVPSAGTWTYTVVGRRFGGDCLIRNAHLIGLVMKQVGSVAGSGAGGTTEPPVGGGGYYDPGTGGYSGGGGGGGGGCVVPESYMHDDRRAIEVEQGDELLVLNYNDMDRTDFTTADYSRIVEAQPCVRLTSESGIWVECSMSTPLTLKDCSVVFGYDALGKEMAVQDENGFRWEKITSITNAGVRDVVLIAANNQTYAAGGEKGRFIFTHNLQSEYEQKF